MRFDGKAADEIIKLLPPGADVASARAALSALAVFWEHVPAGLPAALALVHYPADKLLAFAAALHDPAFARRFEEMRTLIASARQGEKQRKETFYTALLRIWVAAGGQLTAGDSKTGSACVRYLIKVIEAITGEKMTVSGARKIVQRQPSRPRPAKG